MTAENQPPTDQPRHSDERAIRDVIRNLEFTWNAQESGGMAYHTITIEDVIFLSTARAYVQARVHSRILEGDVLLDEHTRIVVVLNAQGENHRWQIKSLIRTPPDQPIA
ncbi:MAG: hypothetical protein KF716_32835 [Anaerolineae bacterium]|nr:hypothetical protein [Anaerolineae bacterium]